MATDASSGPRRILALDGGGVRGAISIAFLERLEALLAERTGGEVRLCDCFDLMGGTSTGAIIATALCLGHSASDVRKLYFDLGPKVFRRSPMRVAGLQAIFDGEKLRAEIQTIVGDRTLDTPDLRTGLAIVSKRVDSGSAWIVTNNPAAKYWEDPDDGDHIGNRHYRLVDLVRASSAAPHYFKPEEIRIVDGQKPGLFVDGGVTPHNNPSLAMFQVATIEGYGYGWPTGVDDLLIMSVGTGTYRMGFDSRSTWGTPMAVLAVKALAGLIADGGVTVLTTMQMLGRSPDPQVINSEIGAVRPILPEPLFTFQRYDVNLEEEWLTSLLGRKLTAQALKGLRELDNAAMIPLAHEIAVAAAEKLVTPEHVALYWGRKAAA